MVRSGCSSIEQSEGTRTMNFDIIYQNGKLEYINHSLSQPESEYIRTYIEQNNKYKKIGMYESSPVVSLYQPPLSSKAGLRSLENRLQRKFSASRFPATATISLTKSCQCECEHCSAVYYNHSDKPNLSTELLIEAISQTIDLGVTTLILLGGEPLLRKDLDKILASIDTQKTTVILFTNGEHLTIDKCTMLKENGLLGAFVSFDSWIEEEHDSLRKRKGLFKKAITAIENMNRVGLISGISSYLSSERLKENGFEKLVHFTKEIGAQELTLFDAIPSGRWLRDESNLLKPEDRFTIKELVRTYRKYPSTPGLSVQSTMTSGDCGSAFCFAANTQFYLTAAGEMCPCDFTPLTIGKFPEKNISDLWKLMIGTPPYHRRSKACRMQDSNFRSQYILKIPDHGPFPYPITELS
jgi:MoaA/NifB/PqqE/SkfB family radical SAM enzyme